MNSKIALSLILLSSSLLVGCSEVNCTKPVGERIAELDARQWNGRWTGEGETVIETKIKNPELGIVEVTYIKFPPAPELESKSFEATIRDVAGSIVASSKGPESSKKENYDFCRIAISEGDLVIFDLDQSKFDDLIEHNQLSGKQVEDKDKDGKKLVLGGHHTILSTFSEKDIDTLKQYAAKNPSFRIDDLFKRDPFFVFIRSK